MHLFLQLVEGGQSAAADSTGTSESAGIDLLELVLNSGYVMIPIALLSIVAVYLSIERYVSIRKAGKVDPKFMQTIKAEVLDGDIKGAVRHCETEATPVANMIGKGLSRMGKPLEDISVAVENVGKLEVYKMEKGMPILATISGAAPMLGFLGTVTGMIRTFNQLTESGQQITADLLSGGIGEAMMTTVAGLIVGIFSYIAYNLLSSMINKVVYNMEASTVEFLDILHEPS